MLYLDTSVFGGYFDPEFELWTKILFKEILNSGYSILYSQLTDSELSSAPERVKNLVKLIPKSQLTFIDLSPTAISLADRYIAEKVVGLTSRPDCIHIALATIHKADVLVSWNFKYIVNLARIKGYNDVNVKNGFTQLEIRTPREILSHEN